MVTAQLLRCCLLSVAGMTAACPAFAAPLLATNLPNIFSYPAPPPGFDAFTASPAQLENYGFPPRPSMTQNRARQRWETLIKSARTRIQPILQPRLVVAGPAHHALHGLDENTQGATQYALNWSGEVLLNTANGYGQGAFISLAATFNVPVANQAFGTCTGGWDYLDTWVGIDGWNNNDVFQAGTESDAYCDGSNSEQFYSAWLEWYPASAMRITNLPVAAGDVVLVWMLADGPTTGRAIIVNQTTAQTVILSMTAPPGITLKGDSAEWIMERPSVNNVTSTMTNYVQAWMSDENATVMGNQQTINFNAPPPGASAFLVTMLNANFGQIISSAASFGGTATVFKDAGVAK